MLLELSENTNRKIIYDVINGVKQHNADSRLSKRKVYSMLWRIAKKLIDRDIQSKKIWRQSSLFQTICIELRESNKIECECVELPYDCTIYKSKNKLPKLYNSIIGYVVNGITTIDGSKDITYTTKISAVRKIKIKGNTSIYAYIQDEYLYLVGAEYEAVSLTGLFEENVDKFRCGYTEPIDNSNNIFNCKNWLDEKSIIPDKLLDDTIKMTIDELTRSFSQMQYDQNNNKVANLEK